MKRILIATIALLLLSGGVAYTAREAIFRASLDLPEFTHDGGESKSERVAMRDGVELRTDVHLPGGEGPWPVVLMRSPYGIGASFPILCELATRYGYACVSQQVRGSGDSAGDWLPLYHERDDGMDTLDWLLRQKWQNGNVAMLGMSYLAATQWAIADELPPEVKTLIPMVFGTDAYANAYERGMFKHEVLTAWAALMPDGQMHFLNGDVYRAMIHHRPALDCDAELGAKLTWYRDWIGSPERSGYWSSEGPRLLHEIPPRVNVPVLMFGGWYDLFLGSQLTDFGRLASRSRSRFVIGPWHHLQTSEVDEPGDIGAGGQARMILDWLDHHLKGKELHQRTGVVETYAFGEGQWHVRERFPPADTATIAFHLDAIAASNACDGGRLIEQAKRAASEARGDGSEGFARAGPVDGVPASPGSISYRYDPDDPVPTRGGEKLLGFAFRTFGSPMPGSLDQSGLCEREDVLTFVSAPLDAPLHLAGAAQVELTVRSDAPDTAFTAKLIEIGSDGVPKNVRDGIASLAYRTSDQHQEYTPGDAVEVRIDLWPIEWRFPKGARIRLDVSSSNFPAFHAHPNRAGPWASVKDAVVATQTLEGGRVSLPVLRSE